MSHLPISSLKLKESFQTRLRLTFMVAVVAAITVAGLHSLTKAASVASEAETMTLTPGAGQVFSDSTASAGKGLMVWSPGEATVTTTTPNVNRVVVRAKGDQCNGAPQMVVKVDGKQVSSVAVSTTNWTDYGTTISVPAGSHTVAISFTNDYLSGCDRNLRLDKVTMVEAPVLTPSSNLEAETMIISAGAGQTFADTTASAGRGTMLWSNGTATGQIMTPAAGRLTVRTKGDQCNGAPQMTVKLDGATIISAGVSSTAWADYGANTTVTAGTHTVQISFTNDYMSGCDRNLRLDKVYFEAASTTQPPPPPPPLPPPPVGGGSTGDKFEGFNFTSWSTGEIATPSAAVSMNNLASTGANAVAFPVYWYQDSRYSNSMRRTGNTTSDQALVTAIQRAKAKGQKVMVRPILDTINNGGWRGYYEPSNKALWFSNYRALVNHYATLSAANGVDLLEIGSESGKLTAPAENDAQWRQVASEAKVRFNGQTTYSANWDEFHQVRWFDAVDIISIDAYFPLGRASEGTLSTDTIAARWTSYNNRNIVADIEAVQARFGKPVMFAEIGYGSHDRALENPWANNGGSYNPTLQQNALSAMFRTFDSKPWFKGVFLWQWKADPTGGGVGDQDHTPQGKPAEQTVRTRFTSS